MRGPAADGVIVTIAMQDAEGASVAGQLFEVAKSAALAPVKVRPVRVTEDALTFWIVTDCGLDATPTVPIGKVRSEGFVCNDAGPDGNRRMRKSGGAEPNDVHEATADKVKPPRMSSLRFRFRVRKPPMLNVMDGRAEM
jgi:hypothetical protein